MSQTDFARWQEYLAAGKVSFAEARAAFAALAKQLEMPLEMPKASAIGNPREKIRIEPVTEPVPAKTPAPEAPVEKPEPVKEPVGV